MASGSRPEACWTRATLHHAPSLSRPAGSRETAGMDRLPRPFAAVVLAGGTAARLDGADKARSSTHGRTLLEHALDALVDADRGRRRRRPGADRRAR